MACKQPRPGAPLRERIGDALRDATLKCAKQAVRMAIYDLFMAYLGTRPDGSPGMTEEQALKATTACVRDLMHGEEFKE